MLGVGHGLAKFQEPLCIFTSRIVADFQQLIQSSTRGRLVGLHQLDQRSLKAVAVVSIIERPLKRN